MPKVYIATFTYNERENIERRIREIMNLDLDVTVLVVDDNSPDGTAAVVQRLQDDLPRLELLQRFEKKGRGSASIDAFRYCLARGGDYVIEMDADSSHDPQHLPSFLALARENNVVIGSRMLPGSRQIGRSPVRVLLTHIANYYCGWLFDLPVKDSVGGFKCYSRSALELLDWDRFISRNYSIGVELLVRLAQNGAVFCEIPITFVDRRFGRSKFGFAIMFDFYKSIHWLKAKLCAEKILGAFF